MAYTEHGAVAYEDDEVFNSVSQHKAILHGVCSYPSCQGEENLLLLNIIDIIILCVMWY